MLDRADAVGRETQAHRLPQGVAHQRGRLQIGQEAPPRLAVRVADIVAGLHRLAGDRAASGHDLSPKKDIGPESARRPGL